MTLEEIKEQVAIEDGYTCWEQVGELGVSDWMIDEVAKRYTETFRKGFEAQQEVNLALIEQNRELIDLLQGIVKQIEKGEKIGGYNLLTTSSIEYEYAQKLLTKYNHLNHKP